MIRERECKTDGQRWMDGERDGQKVRDSAG